MMVIAALPVQEDWEKLVLRQAQVWQSGHSAETERRIRGCLLSGALGDALGYAVEFDSYRDIQRSYGRFGLRHPVLEDGKTRISDDTQMTLFTNDALVKGFWRNRERGIEVPPEQYIYLSYLCWLVTQIGFTDTQGWKTDLNLVPELNRLRAPGNTCLSALKSGRMGTVTSPLNFSKGCGGVMRAAPLGFDLRWGDPLKTGAACGAITHGHPMGWVPAGMLSDIVSRCIYGSSSSLSDVICASIVHAKAEYGTERGFDNLEAMLQKAIALSNSDLPDEAAIRQIGEGWVGDEALAIAVYSVLKHPRDLRACLICAVNHSGDSDSTGAIAGNILGAWLGADAVPREWMEMLELTDLIEQQADIMIHALKAR